MRYIKNLSLFLICFTLAFPNALWAQDEGKTPRGQPETVIPKACMPFEIMGNNAVSVKNGIEDFDPTPEEDYRGFVAPFDLEKYHKTPETEEALRKLLEMFDKDGIVTYNDNGTIAFVIYKDGTEADYSYEYNEEGEMTSCSIETKDAKIVFREDKNDPNEGGYGRSESKTLNIEIHWKNGSDPGPDPNPDPDPDPPRPDDGGIDPLKVPEPIIVIRLKHTKTGLEDIATKPMKFDFKRIKKAISEMEEKHKLAESEFAKNLGSYYDKVYTGLKENLSLLDAKNNLKESLKNFEGNELRDAEKRQIIDDAVGHIRSEVKIGKSGESRARFLKLVRQYELDILVPSKEVYDEKMDNAEEYLNRLIDELLKSNLALYLNNGDKIETVINRPVLGDKK